MRIRATVLTFAALGSLTLAACSSSNTATISLPPLGATQSPMPPTGTMTPPATGTTAPESPAPGGASAYTNSTYGYSLQYPSDWTKQESATGTVSFVANPQSAGAVVPGTMNILVEPMPAGTPMSLEAYAPAAIAAIKSQFKSVNITTNVANTLGGQPAHEVVYTAKQGKLTMELMQIFTIKDGKVLVITFGSTTADYAKYEPQVTQVIGSFAFS